MESSCPNLLFDTLFGDNSMNNKGVPGLRKLCISQLATNDENINLGVYPESDPENIAYPNVFTVKCPFCILVITRLQQKYHEVKLGGGWTRGLSGPRSNMHCNCFGRGLASH